MPFRFTFWKRGLGKLERQVMDVVWRAASDLSVREVHGQMRKTVAYTTVMTTLDRLYKKGLLARAKEGKAYRYSPAMPAHEFAMQLVSHLVDDIGAKDRALLDELERFVREKRRSLEP